MIALCTTLWLAALTGITVTVAPDQPLPHVYIDEPLIIEITAEESVTVEAEVRVYNDEGFVQAVSLGSRRLPGGGARWFAMDDIPMERGNYRLEIVLTDEAGRVWERQVDCSRIERPPASAFPGLVVDARHASGDLLELAARAAGVGTVRLEFGTDEFDGLLPPLLEAGLRVVIAATLADVEALVAHLGGLERSQRDLVARCELAYEGDPAAWLAAAASLRQGVSGLEAVPMLRDADELTALLSESPGLLRQTVSNGANTGELRAAAAELGVEHLSLFAGPGVPTPDDAESLGAWLRSVLTAWGDGYSQFAVSEGHLLHDDGLGKAFPYLAMMAHRLSDYRFMGALPMEDGGPTVLLFRRGAAWMAAAWSESEATIDLPLGPAERLAAFDARGNPFAPGNLENGTLAITVDAMPRFWTGQGGHIFSRVARRQAVVRAEAVMAQSRARELLHPDIVEMITAFRAAPDEPVSRRHFFTLLQSFPELESHWHTGREPVSDIVPLVARLAEFTRALCVLEEGHGEQFLEPLSDTLAQCSEYQALFVTGSTAQGIPHDRGNWLLRDIDRLTAEARLLSEHGRLIEANAVANLAEWRARSLGAITQSISDAR